MPPIPSDARNVRREPMRVIARDYEPTRDGGNRGACAQCAIAHGMKLDEIYTLRRYGSDRGSEVSKERSLQDKLDVQSKLLDVETRKGEEAAELFRLLVSSVRDYAIFMLDPDGIVAT